MDEIEVKAALERWIVSNARGRIDSRISHDQDLITGRVVDSLRFADFILYVEEMSGRTVDLETLDLSQFRTIDVIYQSFFA
jgi:acyl carrier protein